MGLHALVSYDWELALGDEPLTREEFERLAALKTPLVQVRGRWVLLQPDQVEAAIAFWEKQRERAELLHGRCPACRAGRADRDRRPGTRRGRARRRADAAPGTP